MSLTATQRDALLVLRVRLNPEDPSNQSSDEIKEHLRAIRLWLDSWVLPAIEAVEPKAPQWLVESIKQDAARMRRRGTYYAAITKEVQP